MVINGNKWPPEIYICISLSDWPMDCSWSWKFVLACLSLSKLCNSATKNGFDSNSLPSSTDKTFNNSFSNLWFFLEYSRPKKQNLSHVRPYTALLGTYPNLLVGVVSCLHVNSTISASSCNTTLPLIHIIFTTIQNIPRLFHLIQGWKNWQCRTKNKLGGDRRIFHKLRSVFKRTHNLNRGSEPRYP